MTPARKTIGGVEGAEVGADVGINVGADVGVSVDAGSDVGAGVVCDVDINVGTKVGKDVGEGVAVTLLVVFNAPTKSESTAVKLPRKVPLAMAVFNEEVKVARDALLFFAANALRSTVTFHVTVAIPVLLDRPL